MMAAILRNVVLAGLLMTVGAAAQTLPGSDALQEAAQLRNRQDFHAAIRLLRQYVAEHPDEAEGKFMLGETLYWVGDMSAARHHFTRALRLNAGHAEARRQLEEIREVAASWMTLGGGFHRDNQPMDRSGASAETGIFITPLQPLIFRSDIQTFSPANSADVQQGELEWRAYWPGLRMDTEVAGGGVRRGRGRPADWTGRAAVAARLPKGLRIRAAGERAPYLWTISSLRTSTAREGLRFSVEWNRHGWLGETAYGVERFSDGNRTHSAHAWLLAPLFRSGGTLLQGGYAVAVADANESRWVAPEPGGEGRYDPYYTPEQHRVHSLIGALAAPLGSALTWRVNGSFPVHGTELAPPEFVGAAPAIRDYHPGRAEAALDIGLAPHVFFTLAVEHNRTGFWKMNTVRAGLTIRFRPGPLPNRFP